MSDAGDPADGVQRTFERCGPALFRYFAVRTGQDGHLVDDLMQQLWLRAHVHASDLRDPNPEPWLWRIAQNLLREQRRKPVPYSLDGAVADSGVARVLAERLDTESLPEEVLARKEVRDQLLLALTELSGEEQELLVRFYFEGHCQAELAEKLNISERAVEGRLYRARVALRDRLTRLETWEERT
jgi:RNA polymerase sigma factor (sigma-70 family)